MSSKKSVGDFFILSPLGEHFESLLARLGHNFLVFFRRPMSKRVKVQFLTTLHRRTLFSWVEGSTFGLFLWSRVASF